MPSQSTLLGAAGEHHVMSELLLRGYIAALAPQGVPTADIVVTDVEGSRACSIQVKSRLDKGSDGGWHMKDKHEDMRSDQLFYCFVDFGKPPASRPIVYVLPGAIVAKCLYTSHQKWLSSTGRNGQPRKDGAFRRLLPDYSKVFGSVDNPYPSGWLEKYRDAWGLLPLPAGSVRQSEAS